MLYNIHKLRWDERAARGCSAFPRRMLPGGRKPSSERLRQHANPSFGGGRCPSRASAGDQQAALFGQCCFEPGDAKNTYGTGCFLLMNTGRDSRCSRRTVWSRPLPSARRDKVRIRARGQRSSSAGRSVQWLRDELNAGIETRRRRRQYAAKGAGHGGGYVGPGLYGARRAVLGPCTRGARSSGITRGIRPGAHRARRRWSRLPTRRRT